ncbi:hypothetical protein B0J18DRAFT_422532 [Chaetomium sp. MPI-SDFR-AT-0129]|nr:hypothetical protein B0J18DRAFT_422532 [Chaetomium sp. MPI-SDFR-AT-0129]
MASSTINNNVADQDHAHARLFPHCGICANRIRKPDRERVRALVGNTDSTSYRGCSAIFRFPDTRGYDGYRLCHGPRPPHNCQRCRSRPEAVVVHPDCLTIFRHECRVQGVSDAMGRLWTAVARATPWQHAVPVHHFSPPRLTVDGLLVAAVRSAGFPALCELPLELLEMIQYHSRHAALWRCLAVLRLVAHIAATEPEPLRLIPLGKISAWTRGQEPVCVAAGETAPEVLRLTLDRDGISSLERLESWPKYADKQSTHLAFMVEREDMMLKSLPTVLYKNGHLRFKPSEPWKLQLPAVWNTPTPPDDPEMHDGHCGTQFCYATNMDKIRGITFFFDLGYFCGIHVHHDQHPSSSVWETFDRLFPLHEKQEMVTWIYLPLPKDDRVVGLGRRTHGPEFHHSILVRTERGGSFVFGFAHWDLKSDICLAASAPITLFHGDERESGYTRLFSAYCKNAPMLRGKDERKFLESFAFASASPRTSPLTDDPSLPSYFSWAPLDGVRSAQVFQDPDTGHCRGIIFRYRNGGARAVGECRVGVHPVQLTTKPTMLYFRTEVFRVKPSSPDSKRLWVKFGQTEGPRDGWEQVPMRGRINFWFTPCYSAFTVE